MFFKSTYCLLLNTLFSIIPISYLKGRNDCISASPKYQVPDKSTVFSLVARVGETVSVSERKRSGCLTLLHEMRVEGIRHSLVQSPRKCCLYFKIS